jgi:hypothetical protein
MKCRQVQKWLPLFIKDDLIPAQRVKIESHLRDCSVCREEVELYRASSEKMQEWLEQESIHWDQGAWEKALRRAMEPADEKDASLAPWPFKKGWALALMLFIVALVGVFVIRPLPLRRFLGKGVEVAAAVQEGYASRAEQDVTQEMISMTMVSKESGLKIVWIFNKNFEWEENQ